MAAVKLSYKRLKEILTRRLKLRDPQFVLETWGGWINGDVISPTFKRKRDLKRQEMIWDALEAEFGEKAKSKVGMLLCFTPDEWNLGNEEEPMPKRTRKAG
jgi:acid stress-induced BolA-like protein IbaG/YrbA